MQGGSDVITKTALKRINWASYKMNQSSDKIGVFVSVVSTKIPYKGAGKEYIGNKVTQATTFMQLIVYYYIQDSCTSRIW